MKHGHWVRITSFVAMLALTGACAACASPSQTQSASGSDSLGNAARGYGSSSGNDVSSEQRNREIVQSVTGKAM